MPEVPAEIRDASVFLYPSETDAEEGREWGGSGFLLGKRTGKAFLVHLYAVSNDHVIHNCPVVRCVSRKGEQVIRNGQGNWRSHPDGDDVALLYLGLLPAPFPFIDHYKLLVERGVEANAIGPGEDCFMVGRFIQPMSKRQLDRPVLRFGNIAASPPVPIHQPGRAFDQDSFLVDTRSLSGFSGSVVITYFASSNALRADPLLRRPPPHPNAFRGRLEAWWVLGIDWGHLPVVLDIGAPTLDTSGNRPKIGQAEVNSGMAAIVPAWKITELLEMEELVSEREEAERQAERQEGEAVLDANVPDTPDSIERTADLMRGLLQVPPEEARKRD